MSCWTTTVPNSVRNSADVGHLDRLGLLDEGDVPPGVGPEGQRVVVGVAADAQRPVLGDQVPLLAGDLAGLAADADAGVGEKPHPRTGLAVVAAAEGRGGQVGQGHAGPPSLASPIPARARRSSTSCRRAAPRGRRPGWMSQVAALDSWMWTLGSSTSDSRSLAASPLAMPRVPQW